MNKNSSHFAISSAVVASLLALVGCGGGSDGGVSVATVSSPTTNTLSPHGQVTVQEGSSLVIKSRANGSGGPMSTHEWSIKGESSNTSSVTPLVSNAKCIVATQSFENNIASSECEVSLTIPSVASAMSWILSNTASAPSGSKTETIIIEGRPSAGELGNSLRITSSNTQYAVNAGESVRLSCTAVGGVNGKREAPIIEWTYGPLNLNGQPFALNGVQSQSENSDGSITSRLSLNAPIILNTQTVLPVTCVAHDDISKVSKVMNVSFFPEAMIPFNVLGGLTLSGSSGQHISIPIDIQDPAGLVNSANVYVRWSQISGTPSVIPSGGYAFGAPLRFTAPPNELQDAQRLVFASEASAVPFVSGVLIPDSQRAQFTFLNYPISNGGMFVSAGNPQFVDMGQSVLLQSVIQLEDGVKAMDYTWELKSRPQESYAVIMNARNPSSSFIADAEGEYRIMLTVRAIDKAGKSFTRFAETLVKVAAKDIVPFEVSAGAPQNVTTSSPVLLAGAIQKGNVTINGQTWIIMSSPAGSVAQVVNANSLNAQFVPVVPGLYTLQLTVNGTLPNGTPVVRSSQVLITAGSTAPDLSVSTGQPVSAPIGSTVLVTGIVTEGAGVNISSYQWSVSTRPAGSSVNVIDSGNYTAQFTPDVPGVYTLMLQVNATNISGQPILRQAFATVTAN